MRARSEGERFGGEGALRISALNAIEIRAISPKSGEQDAVRGCWFRIDDQPPPIVRPVFDANGCAPIQFEVQTLHKWAGGCCAVSTHTRRLHAEHGGAS
jgi:hypothetical protein